ncbi:MAG: hopanoid-associated sugar epimerase [Anaerolineales bacterium]
MRVFVTGGTGFVGSTLVRHLLRENFDVDVLARPGANLQQLAGLKIEIIEGDLSNAGRLQAALRGCEWVFHVAGLYAFWGYGWDDFLRSNVEGTRNLLSACLAEGVSRVVHTSSIAVLGPPEHGDTADESTHTRYEELVGNYKRSKYLAEGVVREYVALGLPVVTVNPSAPIGAGDWKPTATGRVIVDYLNGKMPAYVESHQNMVDVEDVAEGHLLAAKRGMAGDRYILGGENMTLKEYLDRLSAIAGLPPVKTRLPYGLALAWSYVDVSLSKMIRGRVPRAVPEAVNVGRLHSYYDSTKAKRELGYISHPIDGALRQAVEWYRANGYAPQP